MNAYWQSGVPDGRFELYWEQYLQDVRLSVLNEYIEFIERDLNHPEEERDQVFGYYFRTER